MEATDVTNAPQFPSLLITVVYLGIWHISMNGKLLNATFSFLFALFNWNRGYPKSAY